MTIKVLLFVRNLDDLRGGGFFVCGNDYRTSSKIFIRIRKRICFLNFGAKMHGKIVKIEISVK